MGSKSHIGKFLSGSSAGVTAVTLTYPLDTIRARLAFQVSGEHVYRGIVHTATSIVKKVITYFSSILPLFYEKWGENKILNVFVVIFLFFSNRIKS